MKNMKKLVAFALTLAMVFAMSMTSLAATVTVPDGMEDHTFAAYQIFTGTQAESEGALGDVAWGSDIDSTAFLAALKADGTVGDTFTNCTSAADVAAALGTINDDSAAAKQVAKLAYTNKTGSGTTLTTGTNNLADGYYLIVDTTNVSGKDDAANAALLQVTGNINIAKKTDKPSVEKKVKENNKYTASSDYAEGYNDVADYNIGDDVPFELIGLVPDMSNYSTYEYVFHDTMSDGLTLDTDSVKVYVADDKIGTNKQDITSSFTFTKEDHSLTVSIDNLKSVSGVTQGKYIIVEYTAELNSSAVIGLDGNTNEVYLEYSNNPNQSGTGKTKKR